MRSIILLLTLSFSIQIQAKICIDIKLPQSDEYEYQNNILIKSFDGINLSANILKPKNITHKLPTIIFVNSWVMDEHEYINQAILLAKKGYQVLSYATRGWGCSEGKVNVIGPKDWRDLNTVVDWLRDNTPVDMNNIGISGISYGSGMSLIGLAKEPRIKTAVAMSTWGSLERALYDQSTARKFWGNLLINTGFFFGELEPNIPQLFSDLLKNKNVEEILTWAKVRSPLTYIDEINKRNAPIYISNNFGDNLFQPNNIFEFYQKLTVPKIIDFNQGTHATGEITGLFTVSNYAFKKLHAWFDYWLKGKTQTTSFALNEITLQTDLKHKRERISNLSYSSIKKETFYLHPRSMAYGFLKDHPATKEDTNTIYSGFDTFASTGIPMLSALVDGNFKIPVYTRFLYHNPMFGTRYKTKRLTKDLQIRGIPKLKVKVDSSFNHFQLNAYLYDMDIFGNARLITHGVFTGDKNSQFVDMELVKTAYDVPKGHKLVLAIDTEDDLYQTKNDFPYKIDFNFSKEIETKLELPIY